MVLNHQNSVEVDIEAVGAYLVRIKKALGLGGKKWNVCLVDDQAMRRLNTAYRGKRRPTDVLAFAWEDNDAAGDPLAAREFAGFLGDVVISADTARRNARREGLRLECEMERLILHGILHLLGYDHETDHGEMASLERTLGERLVRKPGGRSRTVKVLRRA